MANLPIQSAQLNGVMDVDEHDEEGELKKGRAPRKYIPLCDVYSATSPCLTATRSKKVKAAAARRQQPVSNGLNQSMSNAYLRRRKRGENKDNPLYIIIQSEELGKGAKRRRIGSSEELNGMGVDFSGLGKLGASAKSNGVEMIRKDRDFESIDVNYSGSGQQISDSIKNLDDSVGGKAKKWASLSFDGVEPEKFVGLKCKVYWPLDANWYTGCIVGYSGKSRYKVKYVDGDEEEIILSNEKIKFHVSLEEVKSLKLKYCEKKPEVDGMNIDELMMLAASYDSSDIEHGDVIWAKLTGHAVWPAVVLDKSQMALCKGLNKVYGEESVGVQFFGTHDFARVRRKQIVSFLKGLLSSCHSKCKKPSFVRGLEEAKMYLNEQKIPERMLQLRDGTGADLGNCGSGPHESGASLSDEDGLSQEDMRAKIEDLNRCTMEEGEFQILSLGKIVKDSDSFKNERSIWPEGYAAVRKFPSVTDPSVYVLYKMEVLRDVDLRTRPLFRVTTDSGEEFKGPTPSACWNQIYNGAGTAKISNRDHQAERSFESGEELFGFSHPRVSKLLKEMSHSRRTLKSSASVSKRKKDDSGTPVHVEWRDLDKCNVCHMDEEYENNLFLQCEKCRMMVHARCYGEPEPSGGALWLCNLCRPGAPESPQCCLCPVAGGAMKPTTDGRWAHLTCAIWIPETCLSDIAKMEPIDGVHRVNKDRWKLVCSICHVTYGACIQCSNNTCRVAYHPLCARAAGFCLEPEDVDRAHLIPFDEDAENQCIQLLSYCRRHRPSSNERLPSAEQIEKKAFELANYTPKENPFGAARCVPYEFHKKQKSEAEKLAASSSKRMYVETMPYLVGGLSHKMPLWNKISKPADLHKYSVDLQKLQLSQDETTSKILSVADKYNYMKASQHERLAFGKSGIHGFGVLTKLPHRAGDMMIEYSGEIIRRTVADRREHNLYNKLVGAGTYMFRIDDERVIDATKAGSIAHLINHSCEPNCYSRAITINKVDHIIIFSKRNLQQWEELTYDYRFVSPDERLACNCGATMCRGVVNDIEAEERLKTICVNASELIDWNGQDI